VVFVFVDTLGNVRTLLLNSDQHIQGSVVEALGRED
jgi:hypothetical protein